MRFCSNHCALTRPAAAQRKMLVCSVCSLCNKLFVRMLPHVPVHCTGVVQHYHRIGGDEAGTEESKDSGSKDDESKGSASKGDASEEDSLVQRRQAAQERSLEMSLLPVSDQRGGTVCCSVASLFEDASERWTARRDQNAFAEVILSSRKTHGFVFISFLKWLP